MHTVLRKDLRKPREHTRIFCIERLIVYARSRTFRNNGPVVTDRISPTVDVERHGHNNQSIDPCRNQRNTPVIKVLGIMTVNALTRSVVELIGLPMVLSALVLVFAHVSR